VPPGSRRWRRSAPISRRPSATRELIAGLSSLITEQFLPTFAALEDAFARRFEQLFDGGEAQLSLTNPMTCRRPVSRSRPGRRARSASRWPCSRAANGR
jgi:chromosome segregation ATPase